MLDAAMLEKIQNTSSSYERGSVDDIQNLSIIDLRALNSIGIHVAYRTEYLKNSLDWSRRMFFNSLVREWFDQTKWDSSISRIKAHENFNKLKAMGDATTKFVLERMENGEIRIHWFPLLREITQSNPVPSDKRGFVPEMAAAWLKWGKDAGKI